MHKKILYIFPFLIILLVGILILPKTANADTSTGLVAYYSFDNINNGIATDSSGSNYSGLLVGDPAVVTGKIGDALSFDGVDDNVDIPYQLVSGQTADFSYSFFVNADSAGDELQYLLSQASSGTNNNDCFSVAYDNVAKSIKALTPNHANEPKIVTNYDLANKWTHIAVTNSHANGTSKLYINGAAISGLESTCPQALGAQFLLGRSPWAGYHLEFKGSLDEVRVYNRVLSSADVRELATQNATNSVAIINPVNGSTVGGSVELSASVSGSPNINSVQYYANGSPIGPEILSAPYSFGWDTAALDQGSYDLLAIATDINGDKIPSPTINVDVDNNPLLKMDSVRSRAKTSATIVWVTDEPTTGQIEYGSSMAYGNQTTLDSNLSYFHSQTISGLEPNTTYHYRLLSKDNNNNSLALSDKTFSTLTNVAGNEWHVTTNGTANGDGSIESPWDLASTLYNQPSNIQPGDTIWVHGGTYAGYFYSRLTGSASAPIIVRNYQDERVIIDGGTGSDPGHFVGQSAIYVGGSDTWYWGLEVMSSSLQRTVTEAGSAPSDLNRSYSYYIEGPRTRVINNIVHDAAQGFGFWTPAVDAELYGNLVYYNGWEGPDRGHGHGMYVQNDTGLKYIANNFVFKNYGWGLHAYTQGGRINNIMTDGNTFFESGILSTQGRTLDMLHGGFQIAQNPMLFNNGTYMPQSSGSALGLGYVAGCDRPTVEGNYFVAQSAVSLSVDCLHKTINNNLFYGTAPGGMSSDLPDNTYTTSAPTSNVVLLRPNTYEPDKTYMTIYNWEQLDSVYVDVSNNLEINDTYEIRDVQDYFGTPIAAGTYLGGNIEVPLSLTSVTELIGSDAPVAPTHTPKEFGTFILVKTGVTQNNPSPNQDSQAQDQNNSTQNAAIGVSTKTLVKLLNFVYFGQVSPVDYVNPNNSVDGNVEKNKKDPVTGDDKNASKITIYFGLAGVLVVTGAVFISILYIKRKTK